MSLEDGRRRQNVSSWLQVFAETPDSNQAVEIDSPEGEKLNTDWVLINPETGKQVEPDNLLLWEGRGAPMLEVEGGVNSRVSFSMIRHNEPAAVAVRNKLANDELLNFSIHSAAAGRAGPVQDHSADPDRRTGRRAAAGARGPEDFRYLHAGTRSPSPSSRPA